MTYILKPEDSLKLFDQFGGGKAAHLARLFQKQYPVPQWFCLKSDAFNDFISHNQLQDSLAIDEDPLQHELRVEKVFQDSIFSTALKNQVLNELKELNLSEVFVSVRSSGIGEDSAEHSFAGLFSTFLYQRGSEAIFQSIKRCWASAFSARASMYRKERGLQTKPIEMGVIIQKMVNADSAGVAFSRNPIHPLDRDHLIVSSVYGLGEGLVSGELDADHFEVHRGTFAVKSKIVEKTHAFYRNEKEEGGAVRKEVPLPRQGQASLAPDQVTEIAKIALKLEDDFGSPQDCEWAYENSRLFLLQTRPITHLPNDSFFEPQIKGDRVILWDNSNIVESYSGVTTPLTFSFASYAYRQVYLQFCELIQVPKDVIVKNETTFRNMLGLIRGRIYYNLENWYRVVQFLPGGSKNSDYMETMMGVKQKSESKAETSHPGLLKKISILGSTLFHFLKIDTTIDDFNTHFEFHYQEVRKFSFEKMSLTELLKTYQRLDEEILKRWKAPIINDCLCMVFFGILKSLTEKWLHFNGGEKTASLQNDLLCGQGDLESTEPTKMLMRIASTIDHGDIEFKEWILNTSSQEIWSKLAANIKANALSQDHNAASFNEALFQTSIAVDYFLDQYGFRCINELKLEEMDLHDNPEFVIEAIKSYVKMKSYSCEEMEQREKKIRNDAELIVRKQLKGIKYRIYFWIVNQARKAVKNRENLRFARTKIFGVARHLFRGMGVQFFKLGLIEDSKDIFYLTTDEILSYIEGRSVTLDLKSLIEMRKKEFERFKKTASPPDRFTTAGAVGVTCTFAQVLCDSDLLRGDPNMDLDPNILLGTPCCPGVIEGIVRVVESAHDAKGMSGEILVTAKTDPGWVPLFPSCSGLLIERGSLLSHSAVVARELGLPTIVGISGGLLKKLKTGQRVRMDAGKGEVRIIA